MAPPRGLSVDGTSSGTPEWRGKGSLWSAAQVLLFLSCSGARLRYGRQFGSLSPSIERDPRAQQVYIYFGLFIPLTRYLGLFGRYHWKDFFLCVRQSAPTGGSAKCCVDFFLPFFARCNFSIQESKVRKLEKTRPVSKYNFNVPPKTSVYRACCCYYGALHLFCPRFLCVSRRVDDKKESRNSVGKCPEVQFYRAGCHLKMRRMSWCALTLLCVWSPARNRDDTKATSSQQQPASLLLLLLRT